MIPVGRITRDLETVYIDGSPVALDDIGTLSDLLDQLIPYVLYAETGGPVRIGSCIIDLTAPEAMRLAGIIAQTLDGGSAFYTIPGTAANT